MHYPTRAEIEELSTDERLQLIGDLWETIDPSPGSMPLPESHRMVLEQRMAALEQNPAATVSRDEMLRKVRGRQ